MDEARFQIKKYEKKTNHYFIKNTKTKKSYTIDKEGNIRATAVITFLNNLAKDIENLKKI
jgi:hypothetical protein